MKTKRLNCFEHLLCLGVYVVAVRYVVTMFIFYAVLERVLNLLKKEGY